MTENEKMIESINRRLSNLSAKRLRLILQILYQFDKYPEKEEATN